jgi:3-oxoacyl-[acyl-carrier protein] reductase
MVLGTEAVSLDGTVAVVTGGGAGIGQGIAAGLTAFGARVAIWERERERCEAVAGEVDGLACVTDVRDEDQVDDALRRTTDELGVPTVLVNNAGGVFAAPFLEAEPKGWDVLIRSNLTHVLLCTQRVARTMVEAGLPGSVVNVTSIEGTRAAPGYAAANAGVVNFTRTAALELAPYGIRVNGLAPDITMTEGLRAVAPPGFEGGLASMIPMGRAGHVDELAGAAVFLASDLSSYVTGQTLHVDGGTAAAGGWYRRPDDGTYVLGPG